MLSSLFQSTTIPVLEQVVDFSQARHQVLAGNIANLDTPGYRVRDLSPELFEQRLKEAIDARENGEAASAIFDGSSSRQSRLSRVGDSIKGILYHDDSNDSMEQQVAEISKNQMQHSLALSIMTSQFRLLQTAISERVA